MTQTIQNLKHNLAGELASLYVNYLASNNNRNHHSYFVTMWKKEYESRLRRFEADPSTIEANNNIFHPFYKIQISENGNSRRTFIFQS